MSSDTNTLNSKSLLEKTHPAYEIFKGYKDLLGGSLNDQDSIYYSLVNTDKIYTGYIQLKDMEKDGYLFKDFPHILSISGKLIPSTGFNCVLVKK